MQHLVIIGAGISGLAAAFGARERALERGTDLRITVLEAETEVGGKALSKKHLGGWQTESGPTGYLSGEPVMDRLAAIAGLTPIAATEAASRRFLVQNHRLREIHPHPLKFATSGILSPLGLLRLLRERAVPKIAPGTEESVWHFAARRLGPEAADRLIHPMVLGVFAGDAKQLSLPSAFPRMAEMEQQYGSLFKALAAKRREAKSKGTTAGGPAGPSGKLLSFEGGIQALPKALATAASRTEHTGHAPIEIRRSTPVTSITPRPGRGYIVAHPGTGPDLQADALILATEAHVQARLLQDLAPEASAALAQIPQPPVSVVSLGFAPPAANLFPKAFGALIPRKEGIRALGFLLDSHMFEGRAPAGHTLVRLLYGGTFDPEITALSSQELIAQAQRDLQTLFPAAAGPAFTQVTAWSQAIPQYSLGHPDRIARVSNAIAAPNAAHGALHLAGNSQHGVAFSKAALTGWSSGLENGASPASAV
ncbi:MAG: protoporphyrinogen oxidase [Planctomycetota bacterium]